MTWRSYEPAALLFAFAASSALGAVVPMGEVGISNDMWEGSSQYQKQQAKKIFTQCNTDDSGQLSSFEFCCLLKE